MTSAANPAHPGAVSVIPTLFVSSLEEAIGFYTRLGFHHEWSYPITGEPTHVGMGFGEVTLMMARPEPGCRIERQNLYFILRDLEGYRTRLADSGFPAPPAVEADYGMRDFAITDPWGHLLTFGEESQASPDPPGVE